MTAVLTKTEKVKRLRALAAEIKPTLRCPRNGRVEIGHRITPTATLTPPVTYDEARGLAYPEHDDLNWFGPLTGDLVEGAVLHLYFTEPGPWGELLDVVVVWVGTAEHPARIIDPRFIKYPA